VSAEKKKPVKAKLAKLAPKTKTVAGGGRKRKAS